MNEQELTQTLERRADTVQVGPPPFAAIHRDAGGKQRRRRGVGAVLAAAAAVVLVAVGVAVLGNHDGRPIDPVSPGGQLETPPDGYRWAGVGQAVIAVPAEWATKKIECAAPFTDAVITDDPYPFTCEEARLNGLMSVKLDMVPPRDLDAFEEVAIDGHLALRRDSRTRDLTSSVIHIPDEHATFTVQARASGGQGEVERLVDSIRILDVGVAVPLLGQINLLAQANDAVDVYLEALSDLGLVADVRHVSDGRQETQRVRYSDPPPGTVLAPGSTVVVTVRP
ncbi:PASTA domain-containing protein [Nocardioides sp.]|uniref:PASTA domain-containing protein n=1 Tax=Nocardioides sp. TaxID=35761 RepID=UPI003564F348